LVFTHPIRDSRFFLFPSINLIFAYNGRDGRVFKAL